MCFIVSCFLKQLNSMLNKNWASFACMVVCGMCDSGSEQMPDILGWSQNLTKWKEHFLLRKKCLPGSEKKL